VDVDVDVALFCVIGGVASFTSVSLDWPTSFAPPLVRRRLFDFFASVVFRRSSFVSSTPAPPLVAC